MGLVGEAKEAGVTTTQCIWKRKGRKEKENIWRYSDIVIFVIGFIK